MLHQIGLFFHIVAIMIVAGGTIGGMAAETQLWRRIQTPGSDLSILAPILKNVEKFVKAGVIIFLLSGILMLYSVNWYFISRPWFIAKFILFLMLPIRGAFVAKPMTDRITSIIMNPDEHLPNNLQELMLLKKRMTRFHVIQYTIVILIILLVIFKIGS